jgi:hypothetical protein
MVTANTCVLESNFRASGRTAASLGLDQAMLPPWAGQLAETRKRPNPQR